MTQFASDSFTGSAGTALTTYSASWSVLTGSSDDGVLSDANRVRSSTGLGGFLLHSADPGTADYSASCDSVCVTKVASTGTGLVVRGSTSASTCYYARWLLGDNLVRIYKRVSGTTTQLASVSRTFAAGNTYASRLEVEGTALRAYTANEATPTASATDASITAAGKAGLYFPPAPSTDSTGAHLDNFSADTFGAGGSTASVTLSGIASGESFGTASIARSAVAAVTLAGIASSESFGTLAISGGAASSIALTGLASAAAFGTANIARVSLASVSLTGIASDSAVGSPTIVSTAPGQVALQGIASGEAFGTATVSFRTLIQLNGLSSGEAFGTGNIARISRATVALSGLASSEAFGTATFAGSSLNTISLTGVASGEAFGALSVAPRLNAHIQLTGIASAEAFGSLSISGAGARTLTEQDLKDIADAVWAHPKALTFARYIGLN